MAAQSPSYNVSGKANMQFAIHFGKDLHSRVSFSNNASFINKEPHELTFELKNVPQWDQIIQPRIKTWSQAGRFAINLPYLCKINNKNGVLTVSESTRNQAQYSVEELLSDLVVVRCDDLDTEGAPSNDFTVVLAKRNGNFNTTWYAQGPKGYNQPEIRP